MINRQSLIATSIIIGLFASALQSSGDNLHLLVNHKSYSESDHHDSGGRARNRRSEREPVGSLRSESSIHPDGTLHHQIRLEFPPGRKNMTPRVGLEYSSNSGNSILGKGWRLSGLSEISRAPARLSYDGLNEGSPQDPEGPYVLDGLRLIRTPSQDRGAHIIAFHPLTDTRRLVLANLNENTGQPDSFVAYLPNSRIQYFGTPPSPLDGQHANIQGRSGTIAWALSREADRFGNAIDYFYTSSGTFIEDNKLSPGSSALILDLFGPAYQPTKILYTSNRRQARDPSYRIDFIYESRADQQRNIRLGTEAALTSRLTEIRLSYRSKHVRTYFINYKASDLNGVSLLASVRCTGSDGSTTESTHYFYKHRPHAWRSMPLKGVLGELPRPYRVYPEKSFFTDTNGDGVDDFLMMEGGFKPDSDDECRTGAYSDGHCGFRQTILINSPEGFVARNWSPILQASKGNGLTSSQKFIAAAGDINADGRSDVINGGDLRYFYEAQPSGALNRKGLLSLEELTALSPDSPSPEEAEVVLVRDFTGDGFADIFATIKGSIAPIIIARGGGGEIGGVKLPVLHSARGTIRAGDFDGDGVSEVLFFRDGYSRILDFDGTNWSVEDFVASEKPRRSLGLVIPVDFNGDNHTDLFTFDFDDNRPEVWLSNGAGFTVLPTEVDLLRNWRGRGVRFGGYDKPYASVFGSMQVIDTDADRRQELVFASPGRKGSKGRISHLRFDEVTRTLSVRDTGIRYVGGNMNGVVGDKHIPVLHVADIDVDGFDDLLIGDSSSWRAFENRSYGANLLETIAVGNIVQDVFIHSYYPQIALNNPNWTTDLGGHPSLLFSAGNAPRGWVVTQERRRRSGVIAKNSFSYLRPVHDMTGLGFLGFEHIHAEEDSGTRRAKWFDLLTRNGTNQRYFRPGKIAPSTEYEAFPVAAARFRTREVIRKIASRQGNPGEMMFPYIAEELVFVRERDNPSKPTEAAAYLIREKTAFSVDGSASRTRIVQTRNLGLDRYDKDKKVASSVCQEYSKALRLAQAGDRTELSFEHEHDYQSWIIEKKTKRTLFYESPLRRAYVARQSGNTLYANVADWLPPGLTIDDCRESKRFLIDEVSRGNRGLVNERTQMAGSPEEMKTNIARDNYGLPIEWVSSARAGVDSVERTVHRVARYDAENHSRISWLRDEVGLTKSFTFDHETGQPIEYADENGLLTEMQYDRLGRITSSKSPFGTTEYSISADPRIERGMKMVAASPSGREYSVSFDHAERAREIVGKTGSEDYVRSLSYDRHGYLKQVSALRKIGDEPIARLETQRDAAGRPVTYRDGDGLSTVAYSGNIAAIKRADSVIELLTDYTGRVIACVGPDGQCSGWVYGQVGALVAFTGTQYSVVGRDDAARPIHRRSSEGDDLSIKYDGFGRLVSRTLPGSQAVSYSYDDIGRLTAVYHGGEEKSSFTYDSASGAGRGRLASARSVDCSHYRFDYDERGLISTRRVLVNEGTPSEEIYRFNYSWTDGGLIQSERLPALSGEELRVRYAYDEMERLSSIFLKRGTAAERQVLRTVSRTPLGAPKSVALAGGAVSTVNYNSNGRILSETCRARDRTLIFGRTYSYDDRGNLKSDRDGVSGKKRALSYDRYNRLIQVRDESDAVIFASTLNYYGDSTSRTGFSSLEFDQVRLKTVDGRAISVERGFVTKIEDPGGDVVFRYDSEGRLLERRQGATSLKIDYGALQGIERWSHGQETWLSLGVRSDVYTRPDGHRVLRHWIGEGSPKVLIRSEQNALGYSFCFEDMRGFVDTVVRSNYTAEIRRPWHPFGRLSGVETTWRGVVGAAIPGHACSPVPDLFLSDSRALHAGWGRYLQPDSAWSLHGWRPSQNRHSYAFHSPFGFIDPTGQTPEPSPDDSYHDYPVSQTTSSYSLPGAFHYVWNSQGDVPVDLSVRETLEFEESNFADPILDRILGVTVGVLDAVLPGVSTFRERSGRPALDTYRDLSMAATGLTEMIIGAGLIVGGYIEGGLSLAAAPVSGGLSVAGLAPAGAMIGAGTAIGVYGAHNYNTAINSLSKSLKGDRGPEPIPGSRSGVRGGGRTRIQPGNLKKLDQKTLRKEGIDPEAAKRYIHGEKTGGRFNLYSDRSGNVYLVPVGRRQGVIVETEFTLDTLKSQFPLGRHR